MSWLSVANLSAGYGQRPVLSDVTFSLEASQIALLVGPNGSGKSTLLKAFFRLCQIEGGSELRLDGKDLKRLSERERVSSGLAYVPQYRSVFDQLTVQENLRLSADTRARDSERARNAMGAMLEVIPELGKLLARRAGQLSGGERHLLAVAVGLIVTPKLALLDEPLAGLDERSIRRVSEIVRHYRDQWDVAFLIAEHRFTKLSSLADRCFGLRLGQLIVTLDASQIQDPATFESAMQRVFFE